MAVRDIIQMEVKVPQRGSISKGWENKSWGATQTALFSLGSVDNIAFLSLCMAQTTQLSHAPTIYYFLVLTTLSIAQV